MAFVLQSVIREEHVDEHERFYVDLLRRWKEGKMPGIRTMSWDREGNKFVYRVTYVLEHLSILSNTKLTTSLATIMQTLPISEYHTAFFGTRFVSFWSAHECNLEGTL